MIIGGDRCRVSHGNKHLYFLKALDIEIVTLYRRVICCKISQWIHYVILCIVAKYSNG